MGDNPPEERRLILIGTTGSGKSASGNTILGLPGHFLSKCSASSITQVCQVGTSEYHVEEEVGRRRRRRVVVVDLPGFGDTNLSQEQIITEVSRCVVLTAPGPHAFLLVVPLGRYTEEDNMAVTLMAAVFGEAALHNHTVVLFTHGDDLEEPMEEYLASAPAHLKTLIDRCGGRYHVLNNRAPGDVEQVHKLLRKVEQVVDDNGGGCYTNAMYQEVEAASREEDRLRREEDRLRREEEDRLRREEEDRLRRKEEDRLRREEDRLRREKEEEDRLRRRSVPGQGWRTDDGKESRGKRPQSPPSTRGSGSSQLRFSRVMQRVRVVVAAALTGLVVGAVCGEAAPLALAAGAALVGNTLALSASSLGVGAAIGGAVGGVMGTVVGLEADSPGEGAQEALDLVGTLGAILVVAVMAVGTLGLLGD